MSAAEENIYLREILKREQEERKLLISTIKRALSVIGLFPIPDEKNAKRAAVKAVTQLGSQMLINSKAVEEKFSFLADLMPIIEKYKDEPIN